MFSSDHAKRDDWRAHWTQSRELDNEFLDMWKKGLGLNSARLFSKASRPRQILEDASPAKITRFTPSGECSFIGSNIFQIDAASGVIDKKGVVVYTRQNFPLVMQKQPEITEGLTERSWYPAELSFCGRPKERLRASFRVLVEEYLVP